MDAKPEGVDRKEPRSHEDEIGEVLDGIPALARYRLGSCVAIPWHRDSTFLLKHGTVLLLKRRCLNCLHLRLDKGCGIGKDCRKICLVPGENQAGWTNIPDMTQAAIVFLAKMYTLLDEEAPAFVASQVPPDFLDECCEKFVSIKPVALRMLADFDTQAVQATSQLPGPDRQRFLKDIERDRAELLDRLSVLV